jgi:hypothetical protein
MSANQQQKNNKKNNILLSRNSTHSPHLISDRAIAGRRGTCNAKKRSSTHRATSFKMLWTSDAEGSCKGASRGEAAADANNDDDDDDEDLEDAALGCLTTEFATSGSICDDFATATASPQRPSSHSAASASSGSARSTTPGSEATESHSRAASLQRRPSPPTPPPPPRTPIPHSRACPLPCPSSPRRSQPCSGPAVAAAMVASSTAVLAASRTASLGCALTSRTSASPPAASQGCAGASGPADTGTKGAKGAKGAGRQTASAALTSACVRGGSAPSAWSCMPAE